MAFDRSPVIEAVEDYEPESVEVIIAGRKLTVYEMSLVALENATKIIEPYLASIMQIFQAEGFVNVAKGGEIDMDTLLPQIMDLLRSKLLAILTDAPAAVLRAIICMMNADPDNEEMLNVLRAATPRELMALLEKMNELNDFKQVLTQITEISGYLRGRYVPEME